MKVLEWNKVYQGDNLPYLQKMIKDGVSFNLILADPPYNINKDFGNDTDKMSVEDFVKGMDERVSLLKDLLTPNGSIIFFCSQIYVGDMQDILQKNFCQRRLNIWYYENGMSRQTHAPVSEFEPFWWFSGSNDSWIYNIDDVRIPYKSERVKNPVYKYNSKGDRVAWTPNPKGRKHGDVWCHPVLSGKRFELERTDHPTQKPESLITEIIQAFCPKDANNKYAGRVLDPYLGSGTTAVCCERLNLSQGHSIKWSGIELESKWVDVANERIKRERDKPVEIDIFE